jgi:hypothetical protein
MRFTRRQLSAFLPDEESIREFERLYVQTQTLEEAGGSDALEQQTAAADARAADALSRLARLEQIVQHLISMPSTAHNSVTTDYIDLAAVGPHVTLPRRVQWNEGDGTLDVGLLNDVVLQCGQELHYYAKNTSGSTITDGTAVMATGTIGASGKLKIGPAVADGSVAADYMLGVATQDIENNEFGYVTAYGLVRGIDTTGTPYGETWADEDILYFSPTTPGALTNVAPDAPNLRGKQAIVIHAGSGGSGSILVRTKVSDTLRGLDDAYMPSPRDLSYPAWNAANSRWENSTVWQDIDFPIIIRTTGANIPTLATVQGNITAPQWAVNDYSVCEGQELIHAWKEGSQVSWHVHFMTNGVDGTDRYVKWEVEWFRVNVGGAITASTTDTAEILIPASTPDKTMILGTISQPTLTGGKIGGHVFARLRRIAVSTPGRSEPTSSPWCWMLQLHVECDTQGSRSISTK